MSIIKITNENFQQEVLSSPQTVLLDFWADWCGPCRMLSPVLEDLAKERTDIKIGKVNIDEQPELANQFHIMSIPTLLVFKNGEKTGESVGVIPKSSIEVLLE